MTEPNTVNKGLIVPNTGDLSGTWGSAALNPDYVAIDGMLGGFVTVSLTNANVTLSSPAGATIVPAAGPNQSQNARIAFSGTLTGNCIITFPLPGFYIVKNNCTVGAFYVQASCGSGNKVGLPPGKSVHIFCDGTDVEFVDMPDVGSYMDYAGGSVPAWITACTVLPWLVCDGATPLIATYPQLAAILGTTYGGNGINTFGLPDLRNRYRIPLDTSQGGFSSRITAAVSGINGQTLGASGGDPNIPLHTHGITDPGHAHGPSGGGQFLVTVSGAVWASGPNGTATATTASATTNITINNAGTGTSANIPPGLVAGLTFIKT